MKGRRYGFCRDFYGRKHVLPDKIFEKLYPNGYTPPTFSTPQSMCMPCPVEKKSDPVETSTLLQLFINKHMVRDTEITVKSISKKGKNVHWVNTDLKCTGCNNLNVRFKISRDKIVQTCACKSREHKLSDKIVRVL